MAEDRIDDPKLDMSDLKPNSHQYHRNQEEDTAVKKVDKVVSEPVIRQKKSLGRRFIDIFISEDVGDVKSYLLYDVLVPAIKENIADAINGAIGMIFFGEVSKRFRGGGNKKNNARVNYGGYFNGGDDRRERMPRSYRSSENSRVSTDDIVIASRADAEQVLDEMLELLDQYKQVTVADFYDMLDISAEFTDHKYGWTDLRGARVVRTRNGYRIDLPREIAL